MPSKPKRVLYTLIVVVVAAAIIVGCFYLIDSISKDMHGETQSAISSSFEVGESQ